MKGIIIGQIMLKQETKKNSRGKKILIFCLVLILLIGAVVSVKIINHNKNIKDLMPQRDSRLPYTCRRLPSVSSE